jgi:hypothetical protein
VKKLISLALELFVAFGLLIYAGYAIFVSGEIVVIKGGTVSFSDSPALFVISVLFYLVAFCVLLAHASWGVRDYGRSRQKR